jgi:glycosyltransferase involved in cell wall biosynthesis
MHIMEDHISICICTYLRPTLLSQLIVRLKNQRTDGLFTYSVVVVDNDASGSGKAAVAGAGAATSMPISYHIEPERNIAMARNRSIEKAQGNMIAFIDDDEFPADDWLYQHFRLLKDSRASGILGPVRAHFNQETPSWLTKSGLLERREFVTGQKIPNSRFTRTGNALLWRSLFADAEDRFDPAYGKTGGSDAIFFKRMMRKGHQFLWCNDAVVYETVLPERQVKSYYIKRAFTRGLGEAQDAPLMSLRTLRSVVAVPIYAILLPFARLAGPHVFMRYLVKECDHLSLVLAQFGIRVVKERPY